MNAVANAVPKGKVRVYACGGAAINIATLIGTHAVDSAIIADFEVVMIDTSRANLMDSKNKYDNFLVEGLDGSGKIRRENSAAIQARVKEILQKHKPADLNIILSSAGGGSGSVIAPLLAKELLAKKSPVVVMAIGGTSSKLEAQNSLNTLKSYEAVAEQADAPVVMQYLQNSTSMPRALVDERIIGQIIYLGILYSRRNRELDTKDLYNWLRFNNGVTSFGPRLSILSTFVHEVGDDNVSKEIGKLGNVISVATLAPSGARTDLSIVPEYSTVGILPDAEEGGGGPNVLNGKILNYVITDGLIKEIAGGLQKFLDELQAGVAARQSNHGILEGDDQPDAHGLVL